jgi:hypothetical protein
MFERAWQGWLKIAHKIGRFQTMLLVGLLYWLVVPLFSLVRLADPLRLKAGRTKNQTATYWRPRPQGTPTLMQMRRQG